MEKTVAVAFKNLSYTDIFVSVGFQIESLINFLL